MKKFYALLSVLIFMLCGCSEINSNKKTDYVSESSSAISEQYSAPNVDFNIPDNFAHKSTASNQNAYVYNDASIIVNEDLLSEKAPTLNQYVSDTEYLYSSLTDKYELTERTELNVNGLETIILEFTYELEAENGTFSKSCLVAFYADNISNLQNIFIVTCKSDTENYQTYKEDFMKTIKSLKLKQ